MREVAGTGIYIGFVVATRDVISSRMYLALRQLQYEGHVCRISSSIRIYEIPRLTFDLKKAARPQRVLGY